MLLPELWMIFVAAVKSPTTGRGGVFANTVVWEATG